MKSNATVEAQMAEVKYCGYKVAGWLAHSSRLWSFSSERKKEKWKRLVW
jgi:hypothetical protein